MHKLLYRQGLTLAAAREAIADVAPSDDFDDDGDVAMMQGFLAAAERGIVR